MAKNKVQAATVIISRDIPTKRVVKGIRGLIVNYRCANAFIGNGGIEDAHAMCGETDECLIWIWQDQDNGKGPRTIVMSTGVIGQRY